MKTREKKTFTLRSGEAVYELQLEKLSGRYRLTGVRRSKPTDTKPIPPLEAEIRRQPPYRIIRAPEGAWRCAAIRDDRGVWVSHEGRTEFFEFVKPGTGVAAEKPIRAESEIRAPMTGKIVAVRVHPGQHVQPGEILAVMEAMKMEHQLEASQPAMVEQVSCSEGQLVDFGQVLIRLKPFVTEEAR